MKRKYSPRTIKIECKKSKLTEDSKYINNLNFMGTPVKSNEDVISDISNRTTIRERDLKMLCEATVNINKEQYVLIDFIRSRREIEIIDRMKFESECILKISISDMRTAIEAATEFSGLCYNEFFIVKLKRGLLSENKILLEVGYTEMIYIIKKIKEFKENITKYIAVYNFIENSCIFGTYTTELINLSKKIMNYSYSKMYCNLEKNEIVTPRERAFIRLIIYVIRFCKSNITTEIENDCIESDSEFKNKKAIDIFYNQRVKNIIVGDESTNSHSRFNCNQLNSMGEINSAAYIYLEAIRNILCEHCNIRYTFTCRRRGSNDKTNIILKIDIPKIIGKLNRIATIKVNITNTECDNVQTFPTSHLKTSLFKLISAKASRFSEYCSTSGIQFGMVYKLKNQYNILSNDSTLGSCIKETWDKLELCICKFCNHGIKINDVYCSKCGKKNKFI